VLPLLRGGSSIILTSNQQLIQCVRTGSRCRRDRRMWSLRTVKDVYTRGPEPSRLTGPRTRAHRDIGATTPERLVLPCSRAMWSLGCGSSVDVEFLQIISPTSQQIFVKTPSKFGSSPGRHPPLRCGSSLSPPNPDPIGCASRSPQIPPPVRRRRRHEVSVCRRAPPLRLQVC
jgi:hypothetical protein